MLLTIGRITDRAPLGPVPTNVHVETWVPQDDVLSHAALVLCHGGSGTTFGALAAGVPLVIMPLFADQPANGRLVTAAGAGLVVEPEGSENAAGAVGPSVAPRLRAAIETVLADTSYRQAATSIANEMRALPAVGEVLDFLGAASPLR